MKKKKQRTLILASGSQIRKDLLQKAGLSFEVVVSQCEEIAIENESAQAMALRFARLKAKNVSLLHPEALVIGADQSGALDNSPKSDNLLRKCWSVEAALEQLNIMQGKTHTWWSSAAVFHRGQELFNVTETAKVTLKTLSFEQIRAYLEFDEWQGCAGSYQIENKGVSLLQEVSGSYHAILGLPLFSLLNNLEKII